MPLSGQFLLSFSPPHFPQSLRVICSICSCELLATSTGSRNYLEFFTVRYGEKRCRSAVRRGGRGRQARTEACCAGVSPSWRAWCGAVCLARPASRTERCVPHMCHSSSPTAHTHGDSRAAKTAADLVTSRFHQI